MPCFEAPRIFEKVLTSTARFIVLIGGRSSGKSEFAARWHLMKTQTEGADVLCGREYQNSIDDSVHKLFKGLITKLDVRGFNVTDTKIDCDIGGIRFKGFSRNPEAVKSAQNFKYFWGEEAQSFSDRTIEDLCPTIRAAGSQLMFTANPQSSADPFSKRFIVPFLNEVRVNGFYEDDLHLVIKANWRDNPWHGELESQRLFDLENYTRAKYDWIWEGEFNDSVEDPLILSEWFDACIDSHVKLGFEPRGIRFSSHDPSDIGADSKGYAFRHGSVVLDVQEKTTGNINEGCDWATGLAIQNKSNMFTWDCDGMGVGLNRQIMEAFKGLDVTIGQYKGSQKVDLPNAVYQPAEFFAKELEVQAERKGIVQGQKTNKEALKNIRAQYYLDLRSKVYRTYRAVHGEYHDPDTLISFSSKIKARTQLKSELCRMPIKPNANGLFEMYTKQEMKTKFKFKSPNLADSVKMLGRVPYKSTVSTFYRPPAIGTMGVGYGRTGRQRSVAGYTRGFGRR